MHPEARRIVAEGGRGLRDLALVVREHQVHAAAVDVEALAEVLGTHRRALHVPAGEALAPRRGPVHDVLRSGLLPEGEIVGVALVRLPVELARVGHDVLEVAAREASVVVFGIVFLHVEIDRAVRDIGESVVKDPLHEGDLLDDVARGVGLDRGGLDVERVHRAVVALRIVVRHLHRFELLEARLLGDLVLALVGIVLQMAYIRDIAHVAHLVTQRLEVTEQQVEGHGRTGVTQMRIAVDRRSADIHPDAPGRQRLELLLAAGERIVKHEFGIHSRKEYNRFERVKLRFFRDKSHVEPLKKHPPYFFARMASRQLPSPAQAIPAAGIRKKGRNALPRNIYWK